MALTSHCRDEILSQRIMDTAEMKYSVRFIYLTFVTMVIYIYTIKVTLFIMVCCGFLDATCDMSPKHDILG